AKASWHGTLAEDAINNYALVNAVTSRKLGEHHNSQHRSDPEGTASGPGEAARAVDGGGGSQHSAQCAQPITRAAGQSGGFHPGAVRTAWGCGAAKDIARSDAGSADLRACGTP